MSNADTAVLTAEEFTDELRATVGAPTGDFEAFMGRSVIERTRDELQAFDESLTFQLERYEGEDPGWTDRTTRLRQIVRRRMWYVNTRLNRYNADVKQWKAFAHQLAAALDVSDNSGALDDITIPYGDLNAGEWLDRRIEKRAV